MNGNLEMEDQLLNRYWAETKSLCDQLSEADPKQEKKIKNEINRKLEIYDKQINSFQNQFPDELSGKVHKASYYQLQALALLGSSGSFRKVRNTGKSLTIAIATNAIAKSQEKNNARQALTLLDKSISTFDNPNARFMKACVYEMIGQKTDALNELNYILTNFQDDEIYLEARTLKDDIENPPKKGMCFVATAAYGSPLSPEVVMLSNFRDEILLNSAYGRAFVKFYYFVSPPLASMIAKTELLRAATRCILLAPILRLLKAKKPNS